MVETMAITMELPERANIIIGQAHFIKTAEDIYETLINAAPGIKFGIAFCEASGPRLIRIEGNDEYLQETSARNAKNIAAGHTFVILMKEAYPINVLNALKLCPEVCTVFCATANPLQVIVAKTVQGNGIIGVVDGYSPAGTETEKDIRDRRQLLRKIGYKLP
ncbi:hypothetical protein KsCSTR_03790 [Candidatus Kuenenia stuttgartiensis]|jgi:adenosine/AMP kinase|uniref:Adenosine specific kinase n=1 Tax=Kuenenia stuttgartiensis TaxID=174633 RepID=Q1PXU4_KUEST|nr:MULTISPECIES: adenosine-specific kinase [Kuenenia]MCF6151120.1 hypothetical protein [Candidatus Kuenenia stuttgartiensis]MCZ7623431.1 adenosine-specific kinase [Candidatus Kuenenia sp.]QII09758.1 hypothetical protein KsCSTR_03790 [Candidatus Kuenenia stuttgartiensis]TVM01322.1 MAG: hypothetical protein CV080_05115 [Candidatus Kuenenia stuttgartiensis]CAJ72857.1 conserved hypothetical protein [Candidatus Kuenenia stuttgartiensis]